MRLIMGNRNQWLIYLLLIFLVGFNACKSLDRIFVGSATDPLDEDELVDLIIDKQLNYHDIFFKRAFIEIEQNGKNQAVRANIYLKKDSAIIISVVPIMGIELYRLLLDKEGVYLIDRMNRTTSEMDYASISKRVLVDFTYDQIQSILTNGVFTYPVNNIQSLRKFSGTKKETHYSLTSAGVSRFRNDESFQIVDILPDVFRISNAYISYPKKEISLNIAYSDFVSLSGDIPFPSKIVIQGNKSQEAIVLTLTFPIVDINGNQSLLFSIPPSYAKVKF
jgi:hypothetical protein